MHFTMYGRGVGCGSIAYLEAGGGGDSISGNLEGVPIVAVWVVRFVFGGFVVARGALVVVGSFPLGG